MPKHIIKQGQCLESIAFMHDLFWETIWNDPRNDGLKQKRKNPNVLMPGDEVFIPEKQEKQISCETENTHRFLRKGVPSKIHIVVKKEGEPLADEPYKLNIDGKWFSGTTNDQGEINHPIPPNSKKGSLIVGKDDDTLEYELELGGVDPIDEISGIQARLINLGFLCCENDGNMTLETEKALKKFQTQAGLELTGKPDQETCDALKDAYGN
ncbi:MAG: peptidoglycan-binding domain-containing protein [Pseudomonadota bacterium]